MLLVSLIFTNMLINCTLPIISDPVLEGGDFRGRRVVVSTVLIVV